jgi:2,4-dienoyl-CoA reductase-like NADH-dependent reductase (Old Yellow Enzyme family)
MARKSRREFVELGVLGTAGLALGAVAAGQPGAHAAQSATDTVFTEGRVGSLRLKNRLVRAATAEGASPLGKMTIPGLKIYHDLAIGGVGMIITGHMVAVPGGDAHGRQTHIDADSFIEALARIPETVHRAAGDCPVIAEISHAGRGGIVDPVAPSESPAAPGRSAPRVLSSDEIEEMIDLFVAAVGRAREAGFDGVEIHAAHGYLLSSFLSPRTNRRDDAWGGSPEKRAEIVRRIVEQARELVGPDYPLLIKMNGNDHGIGDDAAEAFATVSKILVGAGLDAVEVSGQFPCRKDIDSPEEEAYFFEFTKDLDLEVPMILTGGNRSLSKIASVLATPDIEFVALARPLIREPGLPARWRTGADTAASTCISCNRCLQALGTAPTRCGYDEMLRQRAST